MKKANLDPNVIPIIKTTNVCIVIGTGQNGTCTFDEFFNVTCTCPPDYYGDFCEDGKRLSVNKLKKYVRRLKKNGH